MEAVTVTCAGEVLELYAARAAFWRHRQTLLIADLHLGKASAFRHAGIPVPEQVTRADLDRLARLLTCTGAERLVVLGDLFHARTGLSDSTMHAFLAWRGVHSSLEIRLMIGNHDRPILPFSADWKILASEYLREPPFVFTHEMSEAKELFALCGHVHPAISCLGRRLPCFHFSDRIGFLPAFSGFTGMHSIRPQPQDQVFAVAGEEVVRIPRSLFRC